MTNYLLLENYHVSEGNLGISTNVFKFLAEKNINSIKEINKKDPFSSIYISIKNNVVVYKVNLSVKKGINPETICEKVKQEIKNSLLMLCDSIPIQTHVKVVEKEIKK